MSLNVIAAVRQYVDKVVADPKMGGMKALILDAATTQIISMVYSQTQILEREVYLVERLDKRQKHEAMAHLKAAVFVQPTRENLAALKAEVAEPKYAEYHVFFTNVVPADVLQQLAYADEHEVIRQVQEYYADFQAVNEDLWVVGTRRMQQCSLPNPPEESTALFGRNVKALLAALLSVKRRPGQVRYTAGSGLARQLASEAWTQMQADGIFDFRGGRGEAPLLLILDRRDDPVTPLLSQWTYQAMVHELLGLNNNRVILRGAPGVDKNLEEVVLSATQDEFFAKHRYANFGDLGTAVRNLMLEYQKAARLNENISSIEEMQAFLERFPAFRSQSINVSKHVAVLSELARLVEEFHLLDVSQFEQELACNEDHAAHYRELLDKISNARVKPPDKLRLAMLYALRYEDTGNLRSVKAKLLDAGLTQDDLDLIDALVKYAGKTVRSPGLYGQATLISKLGKTLTASLQGVENVYAQHQPLCMAVIEAAIKGKLREQLYPLAGGSGPATARFQEVIVFIVGGVTFEEATKVAEMNAVLPGGAHVLLGGSYVHNSASYLDDLASAYGVRRPNAAPIDVDMGRGVR